MTLDDALLHALDLGRRVESIWCGWAAYRQLRDVAAHDGAALLYHGLPVHHDVWMHPHVILLRYADCSLGDPGGAFAFSTEGEA